MNMRKMTSTGTAHLNTDPPPPPRWRPGFRFMSGFEMLSAKGGGGGGQDLSGKIPLKI